MAATDSVDIRGIDLSGDEYTIEQSLIRNKYAAYDAAGNAVLRGKQEMFKVKEKFPFTDADGNDVFTVTAGSIVDVAGNYVLSDAQTGEDLVVLDNDFSVLQDTWTVRDADTESVIARIDSRGALVTLARHYLPFGFIIPHKYEITGADGGHVGTIEGRISIRDTYDITIDDASNVPKEAAVAAAMVIDAIQDN